MHTIRCVNITDMPEPVFAGVVLITGRALTSFTPWTVNQYGGGDGPNGATQRRIVDDWLRGQGATDGELILIECAFA